MSSTSIEENMNTAEQLRELIKSNPATTVAIAAAALGVSRQRISQIAKKDGLTLRDGRMDKASARDKQWRNHWGGTDKLSSHFIGGACELLTAADLLRRGIPVYRAATFLSSCDLIADVDGVLLRIEVRSARQREDGRLAFPPPKKGRYDVIALVDQHGRVTYRPNDGVQWPT
jgi:hypothetical protein